MRYFANSIFCGIVLGLFLFYFLFTITVSFDPEEAALQNLSDNSTTEKLFEKKQVLFLFGQNNVLRVAKSIRSFQEDGKKVALILGASQLHATIKGKPGDLHVASWANLHAVEMGSKYRFIQFSMPNANMNELLASYLAVKNKGVKPDMVLVATVFDDLREPSVRKPVRDLFPQIDQEMKEKYGEKFLTRFQHKTNVEVIKRNSTKGTNQERIEEKIVEIIEQTFPPFVNRNIISAYIKYQYLYQTTELFHKIKEIITGNRFLILPAIPRDVKKWNIEAIEMMMGMFNQDKISAIFYKTPHPSLDGPFFHDRREFDDFFLGIKVECLKKQIGFADFEKIIPAKLWYIGSNDVDLFHFRVEGHQVLGEAIAKTVIEYTKKKK